MTKSIITSILKNKGRDGLSKDLGLLPVDLDLELASSEVQNKIDKYCKSQTQETLVLLAHSLPEVAKRLIALTESTNQKIALEACTRIIYFFKGSSSVSTMTIPESPILDDDEVLIKRIKDISIRITETNTKKVPLVEADVV